METRYWLQARTASRHTGTHIELISKFLDTDDAVQQIDHDHCTVCIG
ncbi:MAG: hypothetical protein JXQ73_28695 [Phycisphaerae bacterium]|nr:hypothetical protein [Phycisphaerae bacterium]